jgi:hypothetical protein
MLSDEARLLDDTADDVYGLWEVDWWFNGDRPQWVREQRTAFVLNLVEQGLIDVFFGPLGMGGEPLDLSAALETLRIPESWRPPEPDTESVYQVMTNAKGEAFVRAQWALKP